MDTVIHSFNITDENGELHYPNTGRDNISGLEYPSHYIRNVDDYLYTRILNIKLSTDTSLIYPIHECFLLTTLKKDNTPGVTNIVVLDAIVTKGTIHDIKLSCLPINDSANIFGDIHNIRAALKNVLDVDGNTHKHIGLWLHTADVVDIIIKDLSSLAFNEIPNNIYHQFLECSYEAEYLDNENVVYEVNMYNYIESAGEMLYESKHSYETLINMVNKLSANATSSESDYRFVSVLYDDLYSITDTNTDEIIKPSNLQYVEFSESPVTINDNYISVNEEGNYLIALKVNMDIHEGASTTMKMSVFLNDDRIEETTSTLYLDPSNKVHPLGFLAGQFKIQLKPSDKLYLKARWTNKDQVFIENHCSLQITMLNKINK